MKASKRFGIISLFMAAMALSGCGIGDKTNGVSGSKQQNEGLKLKVQVPEALNNPFCVAIRVSGSDFSPAISMNQSYSGGTSSVETVVPNIPQGNERTVELGIFTNNVCADFAQANWYGKTEHVVIAAGQVTLVPMTLALVQPIGTGSVVIRGNLTVVARRVHGEVVQTNAAPISNAQCRILDGVNEIGVMATGAAASDVGVFNSLVDVGLTTNQLQLECSHPQYQTTAQTANLVLDPADASFGTFVATVVMTGGQSTLPSFTVLGKVMNTANAEALTKAFNLSEVQLDNAGVFRFVDTQRFQQIPTSIVTGEGNDEGGNPITFEAIDYAAMEKQVVYDPKAALEKTNGVFRSAEVDPMQISKDMRAAPRLDSSTFEVTDEKGNIGFRKTIDTQVNYQFELGGLPLIGPGAKVKVVYANNAIPVQVQYALRQVERGQEQQLIAPATATQIGTRVLAVEAFKEGVSAKLNVLTPKLVYFAPSLAHDVNAIYPHYQIGGTVKVGDQQVSVRDIFVPAVQGAPKTEMAMTLLQGPNGPQITASAKVSGGTPPYSFHWSASSTEINPEMAAQQEIVYTPSLTDKNGAPLTIEYLSVSVTDANGLTGYATGTTSLALVSPQLLLSNQTVVKGKLSARVGGVTDFGSEWIGTCGGLGGSASNAGGFVSRMQSEGYTKRFNWGNNAAWEQDFKDPTKGGDDTNWVDNVDVVFYTGHANGDGFTFCSSNDDTFLHFNDARWGNYDLEWLVVAACGPLQNTSSGLSWATRWGPAFDGLHLMLAYETVSSDNTTEGRDFANYMLGYDFIFFKLPPVSVRTAWVLAATNAQPSSVIYSIMGVIGPGGMANVNDYFWGKGSTGPDIRGSDKHGYWKISGPS